MKKTGLSLIILVFFIPVITYADNEGPGARGLQEQNDLVQAQRRQIQLAQGPAGGGGAEDQMSRRQSGSIGPIRSTGPTGPLGGEGPEDQTSRRKMRPIEPPPPAGRAGPLGGTGSMDGYSR
jgi:hypothetical protein